MSVQDELHLPVGERPDALAFPHFPTRAQAFVWRNWGLVPVERLAGVLGTDEARVAELAAGMGLPVAPAVDPRWLGRAHITIIRRNWHLLPSEQLLGLLGWTQEKLAYTLKEDDMLHVKLGCAKPRAEPIRWAPLSADEEKATEALRATVRKFFPNLDAPPDEKPFQFLETFADAPSAAPTAPGTSPFDLKLAYSFCAVFGDPLIDPALDPYPDGLLARLARLGVNAVWLHCVLGTLVPWDFAPELAEGSQKRLAGLRALAARAEKFGIGVYLYINEPRAMLLEFFDEHPELKGVEMPRWGQGSLCTSRPVVLENLCESMSRLFREVPQLAGVFTISMSENLTHCKSRWDEPPEPCARCAKRPVQEIVAEVNRAIEEGVHSAKPDARVIVWTWAWGDEWARRAVDLLPAGVDVMCVSECGLPTRIGGIEGSVVDYSISNVGPSERSLALWGRAKERGLGAIAKVQFNATWECSAVSWLPTPNLIEEHLANLRDAGVSGLMLSWSVGSYPGGNLELLSRSSSELAVERFGSAAAPAVLRAWSAFSDALREFPFHVDVLYFAPQNYGPMNLLHAMPTGYRAGMIGCPYDDIETWRAIYPEDVFEDAFARLCDGWHEGLDLLDEARRNVSAEGLTALDELERIALAAYCHFRSTFLQIAFVRGRGDRSPAGRDRLREILDKEIELAQTLHGLVLADSRIGFEAANHYYYTAGDLVEKVVNCAWLKREML